MKLALSQKLSQRRRHEKLISTKTIFVRLSPLSVGGFESPNISHMRLRGFAKAIEKFTQK
jgi:hypothetical protein